MKQHKNTRLLTTPVLQSPELEMKGFLQTGMHFFFPKFYLKHARWDYELKKNKTPKKQAAAVHVDNWELPDKAPSSALRTNS